VALARRLAARHGDGALTVSRTSAFEIDADSALAFASSARGEISRAFRRLLFTPMIFVIYADIAGDVLALPFAAA
jgi:alkanesulfonate monooxygenase SsuD/methylene tetrahydromethanopterin reductase-like flavin-dependent oxidoreductase (luciferase family)